MSNQGEKKCWYFGICSPVPFFMNTFDVIYRVPAVKENSHLFSIPGKVIGISAVHVHFSVYALIYLIGKILFCECNPCIKKNLVKKRKSWKCIGQTCWNPFIVVPG